MRVRYFLIIAALSLVMTIGAFAQSSPEATPEPEATAEATVEPSTPLLLVPEVIHTYPHDSDAFIQGLVLYDGVFYE